MLLYYAAPNRAKNAVLVLISLGFYALAEPRYLPLLVASVLADYLCARLMELFDNRPRVRAALFLLTLGKAVWMVASLSHFTQNRELWEPLGVLIYAVTSVGYCADVFRRQIRCEHNLVDFALFSVLFCKLPAGPLVRWEKFSPQLKGRKPSLSMLGEGLFLYLQGLAKKILLGNNMTQLYDQLAAIRMENQSLVSAWMMTAALAFAIYFNLSSLCDMARGLGRMFSLELPRNFYYPYQSRGVGEFVSRFNITVTSFFDAYLPERLRGEKHTGVDMVLHIAVLTLLWGAWFGFGVNYIIWALYFVLFQLLEKLGLGAIIEKIPALFARIYTFAVVLLSFVIFAGNNVDQSIGYFMAMLNLGGPKFATDDALYIASSNYILLLIAFALCTTFVDTALKKLRKRTPVFCSLFEVALGAALLALSTAFLLV